MNNQKLSGSSLPHSLLLWSFTVRHKQPRTTVSLSRNLLQPPPPPPSALEPNSDVFASISSRWSVDNRVSTGTSYLSRDKLLRKMYQRKVHFRLFFSEELDSHRFKEGIEILGAPFDCWFTFPLQYIQERKLITAPDDFEEEDSVLVRVWRVKSSRKMVTKDVGFGHLPTLDWLTFHWVSNASATKFRSIVELMNLTNTGQCRIDGLVECIKCGEITGISYLLPRRIEFIVNHLVESIDDFVTDKETIMRAKQMDCLCEGIAKPRLPIISENYKKINWMFLFCGISLGYCTEEQLRYFCKQRKLDSLGNKNQLLHNICFDLSSQIDSGLQEILESLKI